MNHPLPPIRSLDEGYSRSCRYVLDELREIATLHQRPSRHLVRLHGSLKHLVEALDTAHAERDALAALSFGA